MKKLKKKNQRQFTPPKNRFQIPKISIMTLIPPTSIIEKKETKHQLNSIREKKRNHQQQL